MEKHVVLSASRIKTFQDCSWLYYCKYVLRLPDKVGAGAVRGNIVHLVLELLLNKRHKKHYNLLTKEKSIFASKAIHRLIVKHAKKHEVNDEENMKLIDSMVLVGLSLDFFCKGAKEVLPEEAFKYSTDAYSITGYIDKIAVYNDSSVNILDYKTNKAKFDGNDMDGNLQALMYSLVTYKQKHVIPQIKFLFLRFPKSPELPAIKCTEEELQGFEHYLAYLNGYLSNFTIYKATANYAFNNKENRWLCGFAREPGQFTKLGKPMWGCPFKWPFSYFALVDKETDEVKKTSLDMKSLKETETTKIVYKTYAGCPAWGFKITRKNPQQVQL